MPVVLVDEGLPDLLDWMIRHTGGDPPNLVFCTYVNDLTPDQSTILADLVRSAWPGSSELVMTRSGWTAPSLVSHHAVSTWGTVPSEWTLATGTVTVYGWAAYNFAAARLVFCERFDSPRVLNAGDTLGVLPQITLTTAPP